MSAAQTIALTGLRSAVERLQRRHPHTRENQGAGQPLPSRQMMLALLQTMYALPAEAVTLWAIELTPYQVLTLLLALEQCDAKYISRACDVLMLRWRRRYWSAARRLLCEQVDQPKLRESLATLLIPWLKTEPPGVQHRFWMHFITPGDPVAYTWNVFGGYALSLDDFCRHFDIPSSPVEQRLSHSLLLQGNANQLLREPASKLQHIGTLPSPQRLQAFVNYFQQLAPEEWQAEFMREVADPRIQNNQLLFQSILDRLPHDRAKALRQHYVDCALQHAFASDQHNHRYQFWRYFAGFMVQIPKQVPLKSGQSLMAWHFTFQHLEVVEFSHIGAAYFYRPGWVKAQLAVEPYPTDYDLKDRKDDFFPYYFHTDENRLEHRGDWQANWRGPLLRLLREGWPNA